MERVKIPQIVRQWRILRLLQQHRNLGLSAYSISAQLGTPVRTVYRDLAHLQEAGFRFRTEESSRYSTWFDGLFPGQRGARTNRQRCRRTGQRNGPGCHAQSHHRIANFGAAG